MKTRIFNLIILDESGSMQSIKPAAINGMNETVQSIRAAQKKHEDQEHVVTLVSFNSSAIKTIYDCVPSAEVKELTDNDYIPDCCTPLYDAMGHAINALRPKVGSEDKVLVTVITDGEENSSTEYSGKAIKALVEELKGKGWVFAYIGANQDVEKVAATISVTNVLKQKTQISSLKKTKEWLDYMISGGNESILSASIIMIFCYPGRFQNIFFIPRMPFLIPTATTAGIRAIAFRRISFRMEGLFLLNSRLPNSR